MKKLAIVSTHPIQYNAPWFKLLAQREAVELKVFYTWSQSQHSVTDKVFGKEITWDIPLLEGYDYEFVENVSKTPGSHHFFGIDCPKLIDRLKSFDANAILFFGWNFKSHLKAMRYFHGKTQVWFRGDSTLLDETSGLKTILRRLILKRVYSYVDKAFYVGQASKAYFLKHGLKEQQLVYAPHAIDNDRFNDNSNENYKAQALKWRAELGFKPKDIVILFAGKLEHKKQPDFLLETFMNHKDSSDADLQLLIVGDGPLKDDLQSKAGTDVRWLPFQNQTQMPIVYRLGDIICLPSKGPGETWGLAVNEAMACGKPAIVTDKVGCAFDLIESGKTGFIFNHESKAELKDILVNLNKSSLQSMGKNAKEKIRLFNFLAIVEAIEQSL